MSRIEKLPNSRKESQKQHQLRRTDALEEDQGLNAQTSLKGVPDSSRFDAQTLTPQKILQLQRTIGNQAVMRLLANAHERDVDKNAKPDRVSPSISKNDSTAREQVQRLIGFEIETGIPAKNEMDDDSFQDPDYEDFNIDLPGGAKLDIDSNPSGGGKILEFASEAVDETQKPEDFRRVAATWLGLLTNLRTKALASPPIRRLQTEIPAAPYYAHFGVEAGAPDAMDRASIQATHGLKLDQVRQFLGNLTLSNPTGASRVKSKETASKEAVPSVDPIMAEMKKIHDPTTIEDVEDNHVEAVAGFFTLMANYMISGKAVSTGYAKNRSFLFYKSKLSDVRNKLVTDNPYAAAVLDDPETVYRAMMILLIVTKRKADEKLWVGTDKPVIWDWMDAIFKGTDDLAFEAAKNPWGKDIKPGEVEGSTAAVVEHRDIDKVLPPDGALKLSEPAGIIDYLTKIFEANKEWEKLKK